MWQVFLIESIAKILRLNAFDLRNVSPLLFLSFTVPCYGPGQWKQYPFLTRYTFFLTSVAADKQASYLPLLNSSSFGRLKALLLLLLLLLYLLWGAWANAWSQFKLWQTTRKPPPSIKLKRHTNQPATRPTLSQLWIFKIRRTAILNYIKFADLLIVRL